jgi:hypothetical protein
VIALTLLGANLLIGRHFTPRLLIATIDFAVAGALAAAAALAAAWLFSARPWSARASAVAICLTAGTAGFAVLFLMLELVLPHHRLDEIPFRIALLILAISSAGETFNVLTIAARLILPVGLPAIVVFTLLIAGRPR